MSLTARELLQRLAVDTSLPYDTIAKRVNKRMEKGKGLLDSVREIAEEHKIDPLKYSINPVKIVDEAKMILCEDYTQTLMISAVLGQMVEARGQKRFPPPAFFAFIEMLSLVSDAPHDTRSETSADIEERTTRIIELMTTLVSLLCEWSEQGIVGVADDCPMELREIARAVFRKTKLLQGGLWTCISCGNIIDASETRALMCLECDRKISSARSIEERYEQLGGKDRKGYGSTYES